ncbi:MAG: hypothetical protein U0992_15800 [Planctomycetaceae bacterium]
MASDDESRRWKEDFPQLFAAWVATQSVARRASDHVRTSVAAPSPWAIACLSGSFAVILAFVLLFVDFGQQPAASIENRNRQELLTQPTADPPHRLVLGIDRMATQISWDESEELQWESISVPRSVSASTFVRDDWTTAAPRPAARMAAVMPYYLRVGRTIEFKDLVAAISASETPALLADDEFTGDLHVTIDRSSATLTDSGLLAYTLHVQNLGPTAIDHVRVIETVPQAEHVVNTVPPATVTDDGAFVWELDHLAGAETRDLQVMLDPQQVSGPIDTVAALDVETQVAVKTLVAAAAVPPTTPEEPVTAESFPAISEPAAAPAFAVQPPPVQPIAVESNPPVVPADEPIVPVFANDPPPASGEKWSTSNRNAGGNDDAPITPQFSDDDPPPRCRLGPAPAALQFSRRSAASACSAGRQRCRSTRCRSTAAPLPENSAQPPRPILSVTGTADRAARTGDIVTTVYEIANTGDAPAEGLVLTVFVPPELQHKHGDQVEHRITRLLPGQTHKAKLLTRAAERGDRPIGRRPVTGRAGGGERHLCSRDRAATDARAANIASRRRVAPLRDPAHGSASLLVVLRVARPVAKQTARSRSMPAVETCVSA